MPAQTLSCLSGVVGLVDLADPGWEQALEQARPWLDCVALPGVPEQSWRPETRSLLPQYGRAKKDFLFLLGAAGIWPNDCELITDGLKYTDETIEMARAAQAAGAVCAMVPTPVGLQPHPGQAISAMVYRYFRDTQAKSPLPLVLHQPAGLAEEFRLEPESILSLVRMGKIAGLIMEDGTEQEVEANVRSGRKANFTVIGGEAIFPASLDWGTAGVAVDIRSPRLKEIAEVVRAGKSV